MALRLPRLPINFRIVDEQGAATVAFQLWWQSVADAIEENINGIEVALEAAGIALDAAAAADAAAIAAATAADNAQAAADTAQDSANAADAQSSLANSYVSTNPLSAVDAGADTTINIAAHTRIYGNGSSVSANAGSLTGRAYSTTYWVYYDDPARAGGAVTYQSTTTEADAAQTGDRHVVGKVTTPAAAAPPATGSPVRPPGAGAIP